jgi:hypothetical protein
MTPQVARSCIKANYQDLFDALNTTPDIFLWRDAKKVSNTHYLEQIEQKVMELGLDRFELSVFDSETECPMHMASTWPFRLDVTEMWPMAMLAQEMTATGYQDLKLVREMTVDQVGFEEEGNFIPSLVGSIFLNACLADPSIRPSAPFDVLDLGEVYRDLPYVESEEDRKMVGLWPNSRRPRGGYRGRGSGRGRGRGRGRGCGRRD